MEVKRPVREGRGSGPGIRKTRADSMGPRKDVILRMPEDEASQLKAVAALERTTVQEFCLRALRPEMNARSGEAHKGVPAKAGS